jgi:hypothetical protein
MLTYADEKWLRQFLPLLFVVFFPALSIHEMLLLGEQVLLYLLY